MRLSSPIFRTFAITAALSTTGCASTIASVTDRTIMSDHFDKVGDENKLKSMSGDRRLVRVVRLKSGLIPSDKTYVVCPEPFAGAIIARGSSSGVTIVEQGSATDATSQTATAVDQRAAVVRLYQDATHRWCMLRAQGEIDGDEYVTQMKALDTLAFQALTKPAENEAQKKDETPKKDDPKKDDPKKSP